MATVPDIVIDVSKVQTSLSHDTSTKKSPTVNTFLDDVTVMQNLDISNAVRHVHQELADSTDNR